MTLAAGLNASNAATESLNTSIVASKGAIAVSALDVRAQNIQLSDRDFDALRQNPQAYMRSVEDIANARYASSGKLPSEALLTELERAARAIAIDRAAYTSALLFEEQRARKAAQANPELVEKRARELYAASESAALKTPLTADVQIIVFDASKHNIVNLSKRIQQAQAGTKRGSSFESLVTRFSDDEPSRANGGRLKNLPAAAVTEPVGQLIFNELKIGEVSRVMPHPVGLMIIKLVEIHPEQKQPFAGTIRESALKLAETEIAQAARAKASERMLAGAPLVINEAVMQDQLILVDSAALDRWRATQVKPNAESAPATK